MSKWKAVLYESTWTYIVPYNHIPKYLDEIPFPVPPLPQEWDYDHAQVVASKDGKGAYLLEMDRFHELSCGHTDVDHASGCKWTTKKETKMQAKGAVTVLLNDEFQKSLDYF